MTYKRNDGSWRAAARAGDLEGAMDLLEQCIAENLLAVRNAFAKEASDDPDTAFGLLFDIGDIKPEFQDIAGEFVELGEALVDIRLDREIAEGHNKEENCIDRYVALEERVAGAMKKCDDDSAARELFRTAKEKA